MSHRETCRRQVPTAVAAGTDTRGGTGWTGNPAVPSFGVTRWCGVLLRVRGVAYFPLAPPSIVFCAATVTASITPALLRTVARCGHRLPLLFRAVAPYVTLFAATVAARLHPLAKAVDTSSLLLICNCAAHECLRQSIRYGANRCGEGVDHPCKHAFQP